ncbi:MAG: type Z 30S ribosomal protein S14 [Vampirovibrionales bacterium]|nr:type Z 30S ribosomal protein S14 [Vampirovibrionales bacterium]
MINKEETRRKLAAQGKFPRVKLHNRCGLCGRPRAYYRQFGLCRLCLRKLASEGKLPGVFKASW